jgi:D123
MSSSDNKHAIAMKKLMTSKDFHVEHWYEPLKEHTFKTTWFDLTREQAHALIHYRHRALKPKSVRTRIEASARQLVEQLDSSMAELFNNNIKDNNETFAFTSSSSSCLFFARLSSRSAKDAVMHSEQIKECFRAERAASNLNGLDDDVADMLAFVRACGMALAVKNGDDVLQLFAASQRISDDLSTALELDASSFSVKMIVRAFVPLQFELEFRAFVARRRLAAVSQYYASIVAPAIVERKAELLADMQRFYDGVLEPLVPAELTEFVIDFAWTLDGRLVVVEINLPPPVAGSALFDRNSDADMAIVRGDAPFEFRIRETRHVDDLRVNQRRFFRSLNAKAASPQTRQGVTRKQSF